MKTCSKCSQQKNFWDFSFSTLKEKYLDICKTCRTATSNGERKKLSSISPALGREFYRVRHKKP